MPYYSPDPVEWELYNFVEVYAWDRQDHEAYDSAEWLIDIYHPAIDVEKWTDERCAAEGDTVIYHISVTNPSIDTWMTYDLYDDLLGGYIGSGYLAPGATDYWDVSYLVPYIEPDPLEMELWNEAWVDAWDDQGHYVFDYDVWGIDIYHPGIVVEKWPDMYCAAEGDTVIYTIVVSNPTIDTWMHYDVYDALLGGFVGSGYLAPGGYDVYNVPYLVPYIPADPSLWELYNFV
ncbi:TPA: hypothetical protein HA259_08325, partial [Thermoplasmata archaeon]|nr:hypothetical protein [Thermoplasmata archaeon]